MKHTDNEFRNWVTANKLALAAKAQQFTWFNRHSGQQAVLNHALIWSQAMPQMASHARTSTHQGHDHSSLHTLIPASIIPEQFQPLKRQATKHLDIKKLMDNISEWQTA
eukprot:3835165-Rhodomonas_salina.4